MENAVLRERINDVAAEVARLTSVLEGPGSHDRHDARGRRRTHGAAGAGGGRPPPRADKRNGESARGSLADRMRALQTRASQLPQPSRA